MSAVPKPRSEPAAGEPRGALGRQSLGDAAVVCRELVRGEHVAPASVRAFAHERLESALEDHVDLAHAGLAGLHLLERAALDDARRHAVALELADVLRVNLARAPHRVVPYTLDCNDMRFALPQGFSHGDEFFEYLRDAFDVHYAEGDERPSMMSIGMHCRLLGRPGRMRALQRFLDHVQSHDRVWVTRRIDIAQHFIQRIFRNIRVVIQGRQYTLLPFQFLQQI